MPEQGSQVLKTLLEVKMGFNLKRGEDASLQPSPDWYYLDAPKSFTALEQVKTLRLGCQNDFASHGVPSATTS